MGYYSIRTNDQDTIGEILNGQEKITVGRLPWYKDDIQIGDIFFLVISGDRAKKKYDYQNGLIAIFKSISKPYDWDEKNYKIDLELVEIFNRVLTKKDFYFYPDTLDATHISPDIKGTATQAIAQFDDDTGLNVIKAIIDIVDDLENRDFLLGLLNDDLKIRKLNEKEDYRIKTKVHAKEKFHVNKFISDISESNLILNRSFLLRFVTSICSNNFVILTGLSGSGKTKLAQAFCLWIDNYDSKYSLLLKALDDNRISDNYVVSRKSNEIIELINNSGSSGKKIPIPVDLIFEWFDEVKKGNFSEKDDPKTFRHTVGEKSEYQKHIHGFYNELSKIALTMYDLSEFDNLQEKHFEIIPVGADWTNREPLLGYPNALVKEDYIMPESGVLQLLLRAINDPERPYFLILDEMNLSHVERYFADFLSAIESEDEIKLHSGTEDELWDGVPATITIPKNFFIIGTVNIDETTYMFSPKVLDRANVIEFRVNNHELAQFLENPEDIDLGTLRGQGAGMASDFVQIATSKANSYSEKEKLSKELLKFFKELSDVGAEFGYRTAFEINRFASLADKLSDDWKFNDIMDASVAQKLLPKLHGSRRKLEKVLFKLGQLCIKEGDAEELLKKPESINWDNVKYPISFEKIVRMHKGLVENGFTSFAEA